MHSLSTSSKDPLHSLNQFTDTDSATSFFVHFLQEIRSSKTVLLFLLRKIKQPLKIDETHHTGFSISSIWAVKQNEKFHKFLPDLQKNPDNLLNPRHLYHD